MDGSPSRLFHVLVMMGAALGGGCTSRPVGDTDAGTGGTGQASTGGTADPTTGGPAATTATATTGEPATTGPAGTSTGVVDPSGGSSTGGPIDEPEDCAAPQQFKCESYEPNTHCTCDPNAPLTPDDCAHPAQFFCEGWWLFPQTGCFCDEDAPLKPEDCPVPSAFNCSEYDPEFVSCQCECRWGSDPTPETDEDCGPASWIECLQDTFACCCTIMLG